MTREEIIQAITDDKTMPFIQPEQLTGIVDFVIKNYKCSLPLNLDEAANTFGFKETHKRLMEDGITRKNEGIFRWQIEKAFKAGAEWMAGQGYTTTGRIIDEMAYYDIQFDELLPNNICDPKDKVVVQIRKK